MQEQQRRRVGNLHGLSALGISWHLGLYRETVAGTMSYPTEARPGHQ